MITADASLPTNPAADDSPDGKLARGLWPEMSWPLFPTQRTSSAKQASLT